MYIVTPSSHSHFFQRDFTYGKSYGHPLRNSVPRPENSGATPLEERREPPDVGVVSL